MWAIKAKYLSNWAVKTYKYNTKEDVILTVCISSLIHHTYLRSSLGEKTYLEQKKITKKKCRNIVLCVLSAKKKDI